MVGEEDPELTSSHGHTEGTTTYIATHSENNLQTLGTHLPQLKSSKEGGIKKIRKGRNNKPLVWLFTRRGYIASIQERGEQAPHWASPTPGTFMGTQASITPGLEISRAIGNRVPTLEEPMCYVTWSETQQFEKCLYVKT